MRLLLRKLQGVMVLQRAQFAETPFSQFSISIEWECLSRIAQLLECLRQAEGAELACPGDMVEVDDLGQDGLVGAGLLEYPSVRVYHRGASTPHDPIPLTLTK